MGGAPTYAFCEYISSMVNVLKFRILCSILFWPDFSFLCSCYLKYFVEWQTDSDQTVGSGFTLFASVILSDFLVYKICRHLT